MNAVEISAYGAPEVLKICKRHIPNAKDYDVVIKVVAAGVNRPDCMQRQGNYKPPSDASDIPGLEVAGYIVDMGHIAKELNLFTLNDAVMALTPGGGYAEYVVTDIRHCLAKPDNMSFHDAAAICETFFTVWGNLFMRGHYKTGEHVLIHGGSSGIGTTAIQCVKAFGGNAYTTVSSSEKEALCYDIGADKVIRYDQNHWGDIIKKQQLPINIILDMVGADYVDIGIDVLNKDGRYILISALKGTNAQFDIRKLMSKRLIMTGSTLRPQSREEKSVIAEEIKKNILPLLYNKTIKPQVNHIFSLQGVVQAHKLMESKQHLGKIVLEIN